MRAGRAWHRVLGAVIVAAVVLPLPALLDPAVAGPAAGSTRELTLALLRTSWLEAAAVVALAGVLALAGRGRPLPLGSLADDVRRWILRPSPLAWALLCGGVAFVGIAAVGHLLLAHEPLLLDEMVQLRHARLLAEGRVAEAWPFDPAFRDTQNGVWTAEGWSSVYPPGHTGVLALGIRLGLVTWVGPLQAGAALVLWSHALVELLGEDPATARLAGLAGSLSPFLWGVSGGYLSHPAALVAAALALWAALRGRGSAPGWWALVAGAAAGLAVLARPLTGLVLGVAISGAIVARRGRRAVGAWALGGLPFALVMGWWNTHLYGGPLRFGYEAAFGPGHGLGWHTDPWGNRYGPLEALAYTGADLVQLGRALLETPLSPVLAVGVWLAVARRLPQGSRVVAAWATLPVAAHLAYWHHGIHLGPRMLSEAAPGWAALAVVAVAWGVAEERPAWLRRWVAWTAAACVCWAAAVGIPERVGSWAALSTPTPSPPADGAALVFVHGSWASRVAGRLAAAGMRRDSIETALRRNDLCRVDRYARARGDGAQALPTLDLAPEPGPGPGLRPVLLSPGNRAWVDPALTPSPECVREARADDRGVTPLARVLAGVAPYLRTPDGDAAGGPSAGPAVIWVRDMGPEANRELIDALPDRRPWVWGTTEGWLAYDRAMGLLWGEVDSPR